MHEGCRSDRDSQNKWQSEANIGTSIFTAKNVSLFYALSKIYSLCCTPHQTRNDTAVAIKSDQVLDQVRRPSRRVGRGALHHAWNITITRTPDNSLRRWLVHSTFVQTQMRLANSRGSNSNFSASFASKANWMDLKITIIHNRGCPQGIFQKNVSPAQMWTNADQCRPMQTNVD